MQYNPALPIETFDFIIADDCPARERLSQKRTSAEPALRDNCHRSIYNLWRQVLEYFDAFLIGLSARPGKQAIGFFNMNGDSALGQG